MSCSVVKESNVEESIFPEHKRSCDSSEDDKRVEKRRRIKQLFEEARYQQERRLTNGETVEERDLISEIREQNKANVFKRKARFVRPKKIPIIRAEESRFLRECVKNLDPSFYASKK